MNNGIFKYSLRTTAESAPSKTRTCNLWIRSPTLCPIELWAHEMNVEVIVAYFGGKVVDFLKSLAVRRCAITGLVFEAARRYSNQRRTE